MTLYGKDRAVSLIRSMILRDRLPHAFIIFGEKGTGKKTLSKYIAKQILCQEKAGIPCDKCISCRKIDKNIHPDFITLMPGGKNGNYLSDELRAIVSDAAVAPNESDKKIYFLPDIDKSLPEAQNMLLKVIEEPPEHVIFIMTAEQKEKILPTVLSRVISLGITEASPDDCQKALAEFGGDPKIAAEAVKIFGGNIGRCIDYIENSGQIDYLTVVMNIISAILLSDEFMLLSVLTSLDSKVGRENIFNVFSTFKEVLRDISAARLGTSLCSVNKEGAAKLSERIRQSDVERIYEAVSSAEKKIAGNCSVPLVMCQLSAVIAAYM